MKKETWSYIGIVISIAMIVCGIFVWSTGCGYGQMHWNYGYTEFGADFYTYIYKSAVDIQDNIYAATKIAESTFDVVKEALGMMLIFGGLLSGLHFAKELPVKEQKAGNEVSSKEPCEAAQVVPSVDCAAQEAVSAEPEITPEEKLS